MEDNMIVKTYKYRMYPSETQELILDNWIRLCRNIYNLCIEQRKTLFDLYSHQPMSQELNEKGYQISLPKCVWRIGILVFVSRSVLRFR
jgi:hypothetical protein